MTVHSLAGVETAAKLGMGCVVLSREVSREDMAYICRHSPIKIEVFAHGALCMCYSGQCAMSALIGGRSGNRGACAQPCRLPYRLDEGKAGHPLSLKDACLVSHLRELRDMGVSILKLEGRMKRPEYVAVVTGIYARLLREDRLPTVEELRELEQAFSRQGFTDGYWRGRPGPGMFGVRPEGERAPEELFQAARAAYSREDRRTVPVAMEAAVLAGAPAGSLSPTAKAGPPTLRALFPRPPGPGPSPPGIWRPGWPRPGAPCFARSASVSRWRRASPSPPAPSTPCGGTLWTVWPSCGRPRPPGGRRTPLPCPRRRQRPRP